LVIDAPSGLPSEVSAVAEDPTASVILLTRPDRASLADAADALVWMHRHSQVTRDRVTVVINEGIGKSDRHAKAAGAVLGIRCTAVHRLGPNPTLAPGLVLPSGDALPTRLRRRIASICLDVWSTIRHHPTHFTPEEKP
jgi:MinD-like ATPase involved in chromosome partitioning or flagellar assembly